MKKLMLIYLVTILTSIVFAKPGCPMLHHPTPVPVQRVRHCPPPLQHHARHNSWIGQTILGSAILGSVIINATTPKTAVVQQPVVTQSAVVQQPIVVKQPVQIWIDGHYIDQVQPNGSIIRVWQPGHLEWR